MADTALKNARTLRIIAEYLQPMNISALTLVSRYIRLTILGLNQLECWKTLDRAKFSSFPWLNALVKTKLKQNSVTGVEEHSEDLFSSVNVVAIAQVYPYITAADLTSAVGFDGKNLHRFLATCNGLRHLSIPVLHRANTAIVETPIPVLHQGNMAIAETEGGRSECVCGCGDPSHAILNCALALERLSFPNGGSFTLMKSGNVRLENLFSLSITEPRPMELILAHGGVSRMIEQCPNLTEIVLRLESGDAGSFESMSIAGAVRLGDLPAVMRSRPLRVDVANLPEPRPGQRPPADAGAPPLRVFCGLCLSPLWHRLDRYVRCRGQQAHITDELHTTAAPEPGRTRPAEVGWAARLPPAQRERQLACVEQCHDEHGLYIVDAASGMIQNYGFGYSAACGEGRTPHRDPGQMLDLFDPRLGASYPALALHAPAPPLPPPVRL